MINVIEKAARAIGTVDANSGPGNTYTSNPVPVSDVLAAHVIDDIARAALSALDGELFYILDEGSEPEVGDVIIYNVTINGITDPVVEFIDKKYKTGWLKRKPVTEFKIIQRNGLPCIYRNQLQAHITNNGEERNE